MRSALSLSLVFALALAAGGCSHPTPFDPAADCPKEAYCGQCASRGGCAWCGEPGDTGKGQCVAVGRAECSAPGAWNKTPDSCPAPPLQASTAATTASTAAPASAPGPEAVGPEKLAAVKRALSHAFPQANVTDDVANALVQVLLQERKLGPAGASGATARERAPLQRTVHEKDHRLYLGDANHHRVKGMPPAAAGMESEFTMALPMVRVTLPETLEAGAAPLATELGDVDLSRDHLLGSVDLVAAKYGAAPYLGYRPARVDLITPARLANGRFGAMAVYLGYRARGDRAPSFYMLEAGTATGDARMIYFSPDLKPITSVTSNYLPTPFVTMRNTYSGGLTLAPAPAEDEPAELVVRSYTPGAKEPYITVTVKYKRVTTLDLPLPIELTADAGARVALIAKTMGVANAVELQEALANLGRSLSWRESPHYVAPTMPVAPASSATTPASSAAPAPSATTRAPSAAPAPPR
jgi:hypothetical protein